MSLKQIALIAILILVILAGGYILFFGIAEFKLYSGRERDFNSLKANEFREELLVKGDIETVTSMLGSRSIENHLFDIKVSNSSAWYFYALPLEYQENKEDQKYCVIAVNKPEDIKAVQALLKNSPVPRDQNAPRFEFRGIVTKMRIDVYQQLTQSLWSTYDTEFNSFTHKSVKQNIVEYTIYVRTGAEGGIKTIIIGAAIMVAGGVPLALFCAKIYRKKNMY